MLEIKNLQKNFGSHAILKNINLSVDAGEFVVLVGPSGCGKSTLLRTIAGLEQPTSGEIFIAGKNVTALEPQNRDVAMVFQNYALYPHMTVYENMAFGLRVRKLDRQEIENRVKSTAQLLKMEPLLERTPKELSGGQRQRVALGRALARRAPVLLFDEPLSNLDAHLRQEMRFEIKRLHGEFKNTVVYVTHDQSEALTLGDRIVVLNEGHIEQVATPAELYQHPQNRFVAGFIGSPEMNFFSEDSELAKNLNLPAGAVRGVRPEDLHFKEGQTGHIPFEIDFFENHGSFGLYYGVYHGQRIVISGPAENLQAKQRSVSVDPAKIHVFDKATGKRLNGGRL
jgi:ABC-type sugar transport system ATPase subunit